MERCWQGADAVDAVFFESVMLESGGALVGQPGWLRTRGSVRGLSGVCWGGGFFTEHAKYAHG